MLTIYHEIVEHFESTVTEAKNRLKDEENRGTKGTVAEVSHVLPDLWLKRAASGLRELVRGYGTQRFTEAVEMNIP